jgi:hypothetical protein
MLVFLHFAFLFCFFSFYVQFVDMVQVQLKRAFYRLFLYFILPSFVPNFAHVNVRYVVAIASSRYRCFSRGLHGIVGRMIIRVADESVDAAKLLPAAATH